ncbi:MAG: hypothetical protein A2293_06110 [Elusimicrobia bacterium RIFOXYB2_FULL_49_7]|nr:MAG: hypothetical protein A2293_06110 [Elusimicrobia bacterium RIFOXYB2_FULL_49_7]
MRQESSAPLSFVTEHCQGVMLYVFSGKIHSASDSASFLNVIHKIIQDQERILIDLKNVSYIDSLAMGVLSKLIKLVHEGKAQVRFCGKNDLLFEILQSANLDKLMTIFPSREEALAGWK